MSKSDTSYHSISYFVEIRMVVEEVIASMIKTLNVDNAKWQVYKQTFK